ncbi:hypothetical protein UAJ10_25635 [Nitrospirillum sp. BR 11164]|uniref:hypothetical protein n=1 Tax=Nitrospirillum sp. BR 11164 TaxID=3104324 RepID=UPI002AFE588C|nr:hypothetical protein [Nitrospirillum sp. BR 11164]MEA1652378.1 hypothetical protein [Nitrospirillum sp. BR 11164]
MPMIPHVRLAVMISALLLAQPALSQAQNPPASSGNVLADLRGDATGWQVRRTVTLADLGFPQGISFGGLSGSRDVFFPVPEWVGIGDAKLDAQVEYAVAPDIRADARFSVDGRPRWSGRLTDTAVKTVTLPIARTDMRDGFVRLHLDYAGVVTDNRCEDQRQLGGSLTLAPDSRLTYTIDPRAIDSVRAAWAALPAKVRISVSAAALTPAQYEAALVLAVGLKRAGHAVEVVRLPAVGVDLASGGLAQRVAATARGDALGAALVAGNFNKDEAAPATAGRVGDIVIAPAEEIGKLKAAAEATLTGLGSKSGAGFLALTGDAGGAQLLNAGDHKALAFTGADAATTARLLVADWWALAGGPAVAANAAAHDLPPGPGAEGIGFDRLGLGDGLQSIVDQGEWQVRLDYGAVPAGRRPAALVLDLAPGRSLNDKPQLAHVFVNNMLLRSQRLEGDGRLQQLTVPLPAGLLGRSNSVRVLLQRDAGGGDCHALPLAGPAQLLPSSTVRLEAAEDRARDFFELMPLYAGGAAVAVGKGDLDNPDASLPLAVQLVASMVPSVDRLTLAVAGGDKAFAPDRPFIALPGVTVDGASLPVRLDKGRVQLQDRKGNILLDVTGLPAMTITQLAQAKGQSGLVVTQLGGAVASPKLSTQKLLLDRGNVAFTDATGQLVSLNTDRDTAVAIVYPDAGGWRDYAERFRLVLIGAAWIALTLVAVGAFRRWLKNRTPTT